MATTRFTVTAVHTVKPGKEIDFWKQLTSLAILARRSQGCLVSDVYVPHIEIRTKPLKFLLFQRWTRKEDYDRHTQDPKLRDFDVAPFCEVGSLERIFWNTVTRPSSNNDKEVDETSSYTVFIINQAKPGLTEKLQKNLVELAHLTSTEPTCICAEIHIPLDPVRIQDRQIMTFMTFQDKFAFERHMFEPHSNELGAAVFQMQERIPELTYWSKCPGEKIESSDELNEQGLKRRIEEITSEKSAEEFYAILECSNKKLKN
mmetsp:Transcript_15940/g.23361  ORF Transcript_15940/g.23361 Transcript_15940/m.23361 type:complete len:260 (+) Transcript_15940:17-796(+)|eukprot:CAMPEP_0195524024 /NCGR_PEP_ID=MMETSP0794_2-20130614/23636_1 /TAXON_ID=515487 /ORGANISM="Stephanopyxis turris, Strain CCMP 815" /LENGTH=259 /DNA_ID=CAMNT_0040654161 /DNA_START=17 /DNA_END=796 /DNA_ORIENTATION=+